MINFYDIGDADEAVIDFISQVDAGKDVFITRGRKPIALLIKFEAEPPKKRRKLNLGAAKGLLPEFTDEEWERLDEELRVHWGQCKSCQAKND